MHAPAIYIFIFLFCKKLHWDNFSAYKNKFSVYENTIIIDITVYDKNLLSVQK